MNGERKSMEAAVELTEEVAETAAELTEEVALLKKQLEAARNTEGPGC